MNYNKWNKILGWMVFAIALITYVLTVEPTLSFWDAGEYIATSTKLEVGHPPGAPLYQMLGAVFSTFAVSNEYIALMVNLVASVSSAFTILFMFWCSTNILGKVVGEGRTDVQNKAILGSSVIGALTFTFSDTFWFNAVEAEVYATATFMMAFLLWLGLKWVDNIDKPRGNKWLVLIAFVVGLSFGVHFMALLTIPSIGYLYFFKRWKKYTLWQFVIANLVIVSMLLFVFLFLMPWTFKFFGYSEIMIVNTFGLPFNSGTILAFLFIVGLFILSLRLTNKPKFSKYNTLVLCVVFVFIGFSTWLMLPIRANTQIPINENRPSDAAEMLAYYNREQYGTRSLLYDTYYSSKYNYVLDKQTPYKDGKPNYERDEQTGKYKIVNKYEKSEPNVAAHLKGFLPRMHKKDGSAPINYMLYTQPLDFKLKPDYAADTELIEMEREIRNSLADGTLSIEEYERSFLDNPQFTEYFEILPPSFWDNMKFMFNYQFGYMYWRYLMWNFSGRQDDIQGTNDRVNGNWVTGIDFLDEIRLGSQKNLPSDVLNNKGRNHYYMLPFLLGLIGILYHSKKDFKTFYTLLALFLFTSIALKIFVNETPFEPRERDYSVVGSFMVYALWVGFGVYAVFDFVSQKTKKTYLALYPTLALCFLASPVLMAKENWDDHDRSGKDTALVTAKAYLDSCEPNAIIFTIGDNDTFPLWYLQEVEGYRTDVRVVCTALLQADWYIDQMKVASYNSAPLKIRFNHEQYRGNNMEYAIVVPKIEDRVTIDAVLQYIYNDDPRAKETMKNGEKVFTIPTNKFSIPVDKNKIIESKAVSSKYEDQIVSQIELDVKESVLARQRIIMFDIIVNNNWERPVYFTGGSMSDDDFLWMKDYLQLSGYVYKLSPIKAETTQNKHPLYIGSVDTQAMYSTVMKWNFGSYQSTKIYHDPETRKNSLFFRTYMTRLAEELMNENQKEKAKNIVDKAVNSFPIDYYGNYASVEPFAELYYLLDEEQKANQIITQLARKYEELLIYFQSMNRMEQEVHAFDILDSIQSWRRLISIAEQYSPVMMEQQNKKLNPYKNQFIHFLKASKLDDESLKKKKEIKDTLSS